ncbi:hypothetical protein ACA910_005902 [Epithemia clementina (nom. ined.)]
MEATATKSETTASSTNDDSEQICRNNENNDGDHHSCQASVVNDTTVDWIQPQLDWIRSKGGFINGKIEVRWKKDEETYGWFAKKPIQKKELLFSIPRDCVIVADPKDQQVVDGMQCGTIRALIREMKLGEQSQYAPYVQYLQHIPPGQLPSAWSNAGKTLLHQLLGDSLPPFDSTGWIDEEWTKGCRGSRNPEDEHAAMLVVQRDWFGSMIPLLDIMNTRRGPKWHNTEHNAREFARMVDNNKQNEVVVQASRAIAAGEEIYTNYQEETPDLLRDCGIVDPYPQFWTFYSEAGPRAVFTLDQGGDVNDENKGEFSLVWHGTPLGGGGDNNKNQWPSFSPREQDAIQEFQEERNRLKSFEKTHLAAKPDSMPAREWKLLVDYHHAVLVALERLLDEVGNALRSSCVVTEDDCVPTPSRYSDLNEEFDDGFIKTDTCDQEKELDHSHYTVLETIRSPYQTIAFLEDPANLDMCFSLDGIYQICTKYRPHYHEPVVHYTARFLKTISRVIFIGGGDSMLLHEILKYPTLEFVVGLEIDQKVTRNSFKYFGTQPHWDNDKVQWWYGDAAKSLLLLPKEYFGTFDMVLVDLSETVMSNTVTHGLDIMSALSLLLKPEGIFLKNEMYFKGLSRVFKHAIQIHYYDVPLVCSQCLVLGSNKIDFIHTKLTDHKVATMHQPVIEVDHDFELVHDYTTNMEAERHCKQDNEDKVPEVQERSPGVAMILEAENASGPLGKVDLLKKAIVSALQKEGLSLVSTRESDNTDPGPIVVAVLREGYVVARAYPKAKYCAFDIHMWSIFQKQEGVKKALLAAVGSSSDTSSSFRVAAGGMFGVSTWKEDDQSRGPKFTQDCDDLGEKSGKAVTLDGAAVGAVAAESLTFLLRHKKVAVAVFCGTEDAACSTLDSLQNHDAAVDVIPVRPCSSLVAVAAKGQDRINKLFACEKEVFAMLQNKNIGLLVLDPSAPREMAQIVNTLASNELTRDKIFMKDVLVLGISLQEVEDWPRIFVDHFRKYFDNEPGFKSSVLFHSADKRMEVTTFSSGDKQFITHLKEATSSIEKRTGLTSDVRHVGGVEYEMQYNFKPTQFFNATDYDRTEPYKQWSSQMPVGYQNIFQLELKEDRKARTISCDIVRSLLDGALATNRIDSSSEEFLDLGEGCVFDVIWAGGSAVVLFNGRDHVDINLFTYAEDTAFAQRFADAFTKSSLLAVALRDEMPRGYGRVVNFLKEVEPRHEPNWAFAMK